MYRPQTNEILSPSTRGMFSDYNLRAQRNMAGNACHLVAEQVFEGDDVLVLAQVAHHSHLPQDVLCVDAAIRDFFF